MGLTRQGVANLFSLPRGCNVARLRCMARFLKKRLLKGTIQVLTGWVSTTE